MKKKFQYIAVATDTFIKFLKNIKNMTTEEVKNLLAIIRDSMVIATFSLGLLKLIITWKSFWASNETSRRKIALDLLSTWNKSLTQKSSLARKMVECFNEEQCKALNKQESFNIDAKFESTLNFYFDGTKPTKDGTSFKIDEGNSSILRWEMITYLNSLEAVLSAWRHNIADTDIIKEQFAYLYNPEENHTAVEKFRKVAGIKNYPAIDDFIKELQKDNDTITKGKNKIG